MRRTALAGLMAAMLVIAGAGPATADGVAPRPVKSEAQKQSEQAQQQQQYGRTGEIALANGALRLWVPATYYFLSASEARAHLQRIGAPAPSGEILGLVAPSGSRPIDPGFWGAVISVNPLGRVAEERADRFAAPDFTDEVRAARGTPNAKLTFASPPIYDSARKLAAWTERTEGPATARTVRNEQRILGRSLVAGVTIDARADQIATVAAAAPELARMVTFAPGQQYADYRPGADPAPLYDLPSLVTLKARPVTALPASTPPAPGIPAQGGGLQPIGDAPAAAAPGLGDMTSWLPWALGILVLLAAIPWLVGMARRGRSNEREARRVARAPDPNLTPTDTI